jgi:hypothetical protein
MIKTKIFTLNIKELILNSICIYPVIIFVSFFIISILELIYPTQLTKIIFSDFHIVNLYFMLFCTLLIGIFVYKNEWLNFDVIFKIEVSKIKKINNWILLILITGSFFLVFSKYIYFINFYDDRVSNIFTENISCFFLDLKNLWSLKLNNFQNNNGIFIQLVKIIHPISIILLCVIYFYLFFLIIFFKNLKNSLILSIIIFVIALSLFVLFTANKIILIYLLILLPLLISFKILSFSRFFLLCSTIFIYCFLFLYFINYSRTSCILSNMDQNYSSKIEYSNPMFSKKKKIKNTYINNFRRYFYNNNDTISSSLNFINFYGVIPKMSGEKLLEDHVLELNVNDEPPKQKKKFVNFLIIKEILNKHFSTLNKKGINFKLFEINKEFYERTFPVSTFSVLFINFNYWSYVVVLLLFCMIFFINSYLLRKTKSSFFYLNLIYINMIFIFFLMSIHGINILATQYASFIFFDILIALIIVIYSGKLKIKTC